VSHPVPQAVYARTAAAKSAIQEAPTASILAGLSLAFLLCVELQLAFARDIDITTAARVLWAVAVPVSIVAAWAFLPGLLRIVTQPASQLMLATGGALAGWMWFVGYPLALRDTLVLVVPAVAGLAANRALKRRYPTMSRFARRFAALTVFWALSSFALWTADQAMRAFVPRLQAQDGKAVSPNGNRMAVALAGVPAGVAGIAERPADRPAVLALSGGGYRAALFHAGVIDGLEQIGIRPAALSTVSGGSIIGAYYVAGGTPRGFLEAVADGDFRLAHELVYPQNLFRIVADLRLFTSRLVLLPGFGSFSRTHVEANLLDEVFLREVRHHDFGTVHGGRGIPLMTGLTDLRGGRAVGVLPQGAVVQLVAPAINRFHFVNAETAAPEPEFRRSRDDTSALRDASHQRTALLVAGSGAFPGAFKPLPLLLPPRDDGPAPSDTMLVADGGIVDNSGVVLAYAANRRARTAPDPVVRNLLAPWRTSLVVASDGSALDVGAGVPATLPGELSRAIDVLYRSTSGAALTLPDPGLRTVSVSVTVVAQLLNRAGGRTKAQKRLDEARWDSLVARLSPADFHAVLSLDPAGITSPSERRALDEWTRAAASGAPAGPPPAELRAALRKRAIVALGVFVRTPTLKDQLSRAHADALYRLGRYAVILFGRELREPVIPAEPAA
jgi:predicted acylesterase/phospholipase RssA